MKYLSHFSKETYFDLQLNAVCEDIRNRCESWLTEIFSERIVPEEIYTRNLKRDIEYHLTKGVFIIECSQKMGVHLTPVFLETFTRMYKQFTGSEDGYLQLMPAQYIKAEHRIMTKEELMAYNEKCNSFLLNILNEIEGHESE